MTARPVFTQLFEETAPGSRRGRAENLRIQEGLGKSGAVDG